jgi:hypothetical protein
MLIMLERHGGLNRLDFGRGLRLGEEEVKALLHGFAVLDRTTRLWVPRVPDDIAFLARCVCGGRRTQAFWWQHRHVN